MRVLREISRGGFGRVEEVLLDDGTHAARKVFSPSVPISSAAELEKLRKRFCRESSVQKALNSRSFVPIISDSLTGSDPHYTMPLAQKNLTEEIADAKASGNVPVSALADILNALDELHELGFVHRDLKPDNVLFMDGVWKLSDFGLVLPPGGATTKLTSTGSNWGTSGYCAPEQAVEFKNVTAATDIYAFGCILHDIFGVPGRVPYQRQSAPDEIGAIIEKCTEIKPEKRFKSIRALRGVLLTLLSTNAKVALGVAAADWINEVKDGSLWDRKKCEEFLRFLVHSSSPTDRHALLQAITEETIDRFRGIDEDLFKSLALQYADWVLDNAFQWDFCDILIRRLERFFEFGDTETKAAIVLAAAYLGKSHNRWFVMGRLLNMCGPSMDNVIARRVAIEISASDAGDQFIACVERINRKATDFHPKIAAVLKHGQPTNQMGFLA